MRLVDENLRVDELSMKNVTIVEATGKENKTGRKQVMINFVTGQLSFIFAVFESVNVGILVGCENLNKCKAVVDFGTQEVLFKDKRKSINAKVIIKGEEIIDKAKKSINEVKQNKNIEKSIFTIKQEYQEDDLTTLWKKKINEIRTFHSEIEPITSRQKHQLEDIYKDHQGIFSKQPGKIKNYMCRLLVKAMLHLPANPIPFHSS